MRFPWILTRFESAQSTARSPKSTGDYFNIVLDRYNKFVPSQNHANDHEQLRTFILVENSAPKLALFKFYNVGMTMKTSIENSSFEGEAI